jgi:PAS domain S-box-containing protein
MQILWGSDYIQFYNDAYRPILGVKHPKSLGQRGCDCWAEVWDFAGPRLDYVRATGEATWSDDELLLIDRNGYLEECYFTFSYTPVRDESGKVAGIFNAVNETTQQVISERRQQALRNLAARVVEGETAQQACAIAAQTLTNYATDIPFALFYLLDADGTQAYLSGTVGLESNTPASPQRIDLRTVANQPTPWPLARVACTGQAAIVEDLEAVSSHLPSEPWGIPPHSALVLPINLPGPERVAGFMVAGISPRRMLDDDYRNFLELVTNHLAIAIANARAYEQERQRTAKASEAARQAVARNAALTELDRAKTAFFSNVSHEFRTPLTLLLGPVEEMLNNQEEVLSPHQREQLEAVYRNGLRMLKLVNTLLDFSQIEAACMQADYEPIALSNFTAELAGVFRCAIEKAGLSLGLGVRCQEKNSPSDSWILNSGSSKKARILLADDNADMRDYVKRLLDPRYDVKVVADGLAALAAVREHLPDLVISDVMIPRLDGFELLRELRTNPQSRTIPIILLSALAGEESRIAGLEAGADDYLIKPFCANELLARVNANLSQAKMRREATLREQLARADAEATQQRVNHILESITDGFASLDRQWRYTYVNQEAARLVRKTPEELIGKKVWDVFPEAVGSRFYHEYHRALAEQVSIEFEEFYPPLNTWFQIRIYPSFEGISVYYQDITKRKQVEEALQQSQARYRQIVETSYEGIWTIDATGRTEFVNRRMAQMLGYSVEEMLGRSVFDFMDETARIEAEQKFEQRQQGISELHEFRWRRKDGSNLWSLVSTNAILNERGEFQGAIGMVSDITERKQAEERLWDTNQTLNSVVQACPLGITVFSLDDGRVKLWNPAAEKIFGWSEQDALGHFLPTVSEDKHNEFLANLDIIRQGKELAGVELRRQKKDGSPIDIAVWANAIQDAKGEFNCISIVADISERKRLEEELRSALMKLTSHVENSPLAVVEWDRDFRVTRWSQQAEKLFGWQASEVMGKGPHDWHFVYSEDLEATKGIIERLVNGTEQRNISGNRNYTKNGKVVHCEWYNCALFDESGKMMSALSLVLDVTERKQIEAERAREAAERQRLLKLEQKARAQAEAANRIKDEFLAVLSHELRSPLNPILGWTNLLRTRRYDEKTTIGALEIIERNAKLLTQLIEDLLDVSRILRGKLSLNISRVNLKSTIEAAIETVRLAAQAKSIQITTVFEPNVEPVSGDGNRLQQVVWNLLSNAIKFTPLGGRVDVRLAMIERQQSDCQSTYAQIEVRDTGKGINPDFLPYVFDYFRQADSTTTRTFGGLGLGLAIVRHMVELHGGTVHAESPGDEQGATFTVRLPLIATHLETTRESGQQPDCAPELHGMHILVVDDEADMREFLAFLLEEYGARVTVVASASEALAALEQIEPDLLLSDIGMPDVDGYMLMRQIRAMPPEQGGEIPAIALTAYARDTDQKQVLEAGFQKHLPKPVAPHELVGAIANLVRCRR